MSHKIIEDMILEEAQKILLDRMRKPGGIIRDIPGVEQYLKTEYAMLHNEQFGCMFLDCNYALINHSNMFKGTTSECATYPREIAKEALRQNAVFVILVHNHPSGNCSPSKSDIEVTVKLVEILTCLDMVLFDHLIVTGQKVLSMRTHGYIA